MEKILMTHLYWGDPNEEFSLELAKTLSDAGADILEIGIPYTDPVCDGEVFQRACAQAIAGGMTPPRVIGGIKKLREQGIASPIYLTSYYGPVYKIGVETFCRQAKKVGVQGLIIPDILLEEQGELQKAAQENELSVIQFATVYSSQERLKKICDSSTDFIYCIALPGVTGDARTNIEDLKQLIKTIKKLTQQKIMVGFGISAPQDAKNIFSVGADGIIVGSALARIYEKENSLAGISPFIKSLKDVYNKDKEL